MVDTTRLDVLRFSRILDYRFDMNYEAENDNAHTDTVLLHSQFMRGVYNC